MPDLDGPSGEFFQHFSRTECHGVSHRMQEWLRGDHQPGWLYLTNNHVVDGARSERHQADKQVYRLG
jgi:hypothetical protein